MSDVLGGRFSIIEIISEERLYKTVDTATGSLVAVKKWISDGDFYNRELSALTSIRHPAVPKYICSFEENGCKYIAEEWLDGEAPGQFLSTDDIMNLAVAIAEFIYFISCEPQNMRIHGDIKPSNLIICDGKVHFIDFESSICINAKNPESSTEDTVEIKTARVVSEYFTAPEVFYGKPCLQSDIFSLGMMILWLCGGVHDEGIDLSRLSNCIRLRRIVEKCIAYSVEERYENAGAVLTDLKKLQVKQRGTEYIFAERQSVVPILNFSLYIDCNVCFAWEMAVAAADSFGMKTCVIALTERTQRKLNYYAVSDKSYGEECVEEEMVPYLFDSRSLYTRNAGEWLRKGFIHCVDKSEGKLFYSGVRLTDELKPENELCISDLISWGKENFDCVIFITDRYDDKPAVQNLTASCDYTVATPLANVDDIEACKNYYEQFGGKVLYVAWEYNEKTSLPEESIILMLGEDCYLGAISHDDERNYKRNFVGKIQPIFQSEVKNGNAQYIRIINRLFQTAGQKNERSCISL